MSTIVWLEYDHMCSSVFSMLFLVRLGHEDCSCWFCPPSVFGVKQERAPQTLSEACLRKNKELPLLSTVRDTDRYFVCTYNCMQLLQLLAAGKQL